MKKLKAILLTIGEFFWEMLVMFSEAFERTGQHLKDKYKNKVKKWQQ